MALNHFFPFTELIETPRFPHARTLRTSFLQKLMDTYHVMAGEANLAAPKPHVGVFDYLTLFVPAGFLGLYLWCLNNRGERFLANALLIPVFLINTPLLVARSLFGGVTTVLFSPVIAIVHGLSRLAASQSHADALNLQGQQENDRTIMSLGNYLAQNNMGIEELNVIEPDKGRLLFTKKAPRSLVDLARAAMNGSNENTPSFSVEMRVGKDNKKLKQQDNFLGLFKLNIGNVVSNRENPNNNEDDSDTEEHLYSRFF